MEPKGSLACSQELDSGPDPELDESGTLTLIFPEIHFTVLSSVPRYKYRKIIRCKDCLSSVLILAFIKT
jgi:hypothetical protein